MKAYELLAKGQQNPKEVEGKKYIVKKGAVVTCSGKQVEEVYMKCGELLSGQAKGFRLYVSETTTLEEIPQEVSFMEAVKAYGEKKTVECECKATYKTAVYKYCGSGNSPMVDQSGRAVSYKEIIEGKWFVREDSNE